MFNFSVSYHRFRWYATLETKVAAETFPKFPGPSCVLLTDRIEIHQLQMGAFHHAKLTDRSKLSGNRDLRKMERHFPIQPGQPIEITLAILNSFSEFPDRPFPSSLVPLFQNEPKCETFHMKMSSTRSFIFMKNEVIFIKMVSHLRLALKQRHKGTRKWPIGAKNRFIKNGAANFGMFRPKCVDHLQRWSRIFRSEET